MESLITYIFIDNWQRKLLAIATAILLWFFVSHSITETKTIRNVPIRISNLPADKTIVGLLSNGILNKRINLTLSGAKDVIEEIEPGDLEVNIDASAIDHADWIVQITKKNLVSLNPNIDLANNLTSVSYTEFVIKLNRLVTAKIPVNILPPTGEPPAGYEFLDIWPQKLFYTISGPEEEVNKLQSVGIEITFDLNDITKADLDVLKSGQQSGNNNEVSFPIPNKWKQIAIPFRNYALEEINDPEVQYLRIGFLRLEFLPVERQIPIRIFYPVKNLATINPNTITLGESDKIVKKYDVDLFTPPVFVKNVSRLFLDVIRDFLEIEIVASSKQEREVLPWSLAIINTQELEETYVAYQIAAGNNKNNNSIMSKKRETLYRQRFREYLRRLAFYISPDHKLNIESSIVGDKIQISHY